MSKSNLPLMLSVFLLVTLLYSSQARSVRPLSAIAYQQTTNTRIVVENNFLRFFTGASERMTIDVNGNIGIGVLSTKASLHVRRGTAWGGTAKFEGTKRSSHFNFAKKEDTYIRGGKKDSNVYINDNGGNVGIGTANPGIYRLHVDGSVYASGPLDLGGARAATASTDGMYLHGGSNASFQFVTSSWGATHAILFDAYKSASQVNGGLGTTENTKHTHGVGGYQGGAGSIQYVGNGGSMHFLISGASTGAGTNVAWGTPKMLIKRNGTVGINTSDPDGNYKLHVVGGIRATNYRSDANSYADFVFADDYDLPSLKEVEDFIQKNNHLPDIPSEAEAKANGIDLQEMQAKLLQKIEELTLYVIELKKESKEQQERIKKVETAQSMVNRQ